MNHKLSLFFFSFLCSTASFAQLRKVPAQVTTAFSAQYPNAKEVSYKDNLNYFFVQFTLDSTPMVARYTSKGNWKDTEQETAFFKLSQSVQDGFQKSKYADWKIQEATIIYLPGGNERYRFKVAKGELQKKYLYYNKDGRLLRDALTI